MFLNLLSMASQANQIGVPTVSTQEMSSKVNGITSHIWQFLSSIIGNVAIVFLGIAVICFIVSVAVRSKKGMVGFGIGIIGILFGMMIFYLDPSLVGWAKGLVS